MRKSTIHWLLAAVFAASSLFGGLAAAAELGIADAKAVRAVIIAQLKALADDDAVRGIGLLTALSKAQVRPEERAAEDRAAAA